MNLFKNLIFTLFILSLSFLLLLTQKIEKVDLFNLSLIYDKEGGYEYSLPRNILESFLSGKAFDHPVVYSEEESRNLYDDILDIYQRIISSNPLKEPLAVITAGAPGPGKTIKMRQDLEEQRRSGKIYAYVCPDDVCLRQQKRTHGADLARVERTKETHQAAYNKWRPGSNGAAHLITAHLIRQKYAIYFGSTSTSPATFHFFKFLKKQGYRIRLIHVSAPDDVRWKSIQERDKTFVQTTEEDVKEKGLLLPQRITDTYLAYADEIDFCYRRGVNEDAQLAAKWIRHSVPSKTLGTLEIYALEDYEQIKSIHNAAAVILKRPDLLWEVAVEEVSTVVESFSTSSRSPIALDGGMYDLHLFQLPLPYYLGD